METPRHLTAILLAALLGSPAAAEELPPPADDGERLELHGWAEAGLTGQLGEGAPGVEMSLSMARLKARYDHGGRFGTALQIDAAGEQVQLLDAQVTAGPSRGLSLSAGRFKTPISKDYLVSAPEQLFPERALLVDLAPHRALGLSAAATRELGGLVGTVSAGLFDPSTPTEPAGGLLGTLAVDLAQRGGPALHLAAGRAPSGPYDLYTDAALSFEEEGWTLGLEGLGSHLPGGGWDGGAGAAAARLLPLGHSELSIEPAAAWDLLVEQGALVQRGTAAANLHRDGWHLVQSLTYELELAGPEHIQSGYFLVQAGI